MAFGPEAGGAGGGAASGAAVGTMILPGIGTAAGAVIGGIIGFAGASSQNKALKKAAIASQKNINLEIAQSRAAAYDQSYQLGQATAGTIGQLSNVPTFARGQALRNVIAQVAQDSSLDQQNIDSKLLYTEKAAEIAKQNARNGANSQMSNPLLAGVSGALGGASMGLSLGNSLDGLSRANEINNAFANGTMAQRQALMNGVPVYALNMDQVAQVKAQQDQMMRIATATASQQSIQAGLSFGALLFNSGRRR